MEHTDRIQLPRLKIIHIMIITGVLAVVLGVLSARPRDSVMGLMGLFALAGFGLLVTIFRPNPVKAVLANLPDDPDEKIAALEEGLARRNPYDVGTNALARYRLMELYKVRKRFEDAIVQGRSILAMKGVKPDLESEVRVELAICHDFLGRSDDAEAERMAAIDCLDHRPDSFVGWRAQGKARDKQHRYAEASLAYEQALALNPPENTEGRDELLIRLVLASFNAGRPEETMKWVDRAIREHVSETRLYQAHRMGGIACSNLGRLDEAQHHRQRAYEMAVRAGDSIKISEGLAGLADLHRLRGELDKAEALCLEAESLCPDSARTATLIHAIVLRNQGRLDEAVARMEHASSVGVMASSFNERRMQAALKKWMAVCQAELGRLEKAWENLSAATAELETDPKLVQPCEAAWAWLLALRGDQVAAVERTQLVLQGFDEQPPDASTVLDCLELMGRAMMVIGEFERAKRCWEQLLATKRPPIAEPTGRYYLGECRWHLGDRAGAREEFQRASALGIDSYHARLADQRMRELSKADQKESC